MRTQDAGLARGRRAALPLALAALVACLHAPVPAPAQQPPVPPPGARIGPPPPTPKGPKAPETFEDRFQARDLRALGALEYVRCFSATVAAIRLGQLGNVPKAWSLTCVPQGGEWRGVFGELTERAPGIAVRLQYSPRRGAAVTDPVDTARVSATARALFRGLSAPSPGGTRHEYLPVALAQEGYVEVWFVPAQSDPSRIVVGGDSLIQMTADGNRELGHTRTGPPIRVLSLRKGEPWTIQSAEEDVPLLSELMVARIALTDVPEVRIRTRQWESVLTRATRRWTHVRRGG
jgi:hypothetical protein